MAKPYGRKPAAALACLFAGWFFSPAAQAVVLHTDVQDPNHPNDAVVGRWSTNASVVAVGPNYIITTRHQGGGTGTSVVLGGVTYYAAEEIDHGTADLRVIRLRTATGVLRLVSVPSPTWPELL